MMNDELRRFYADCIRNSLEQTGNPRFNLGGYQAFVVNFEDVGRVALVCRIIDESEISNNPDAFRTMEGNWVVRDPSLDIRIDDE